MVIAIIAALLNAIATFGPILPRGIDKSELAQPLAVAELLRTCIS